MDLLLEQDSVTYHSFEFLSEDLEYSKTISSIINYTW